LRQPFDGHLEELIFAFVPHGSPADAAGFWNCSFGRGLAALLGQDLVKAAFTESETIAHPIKEHVAVAVGLSGQWINSHRPVRAKSATPGAAHSM
jgi:hypothetical protein